ncbi:hypothetical protein BC938DRAFT_476717 [Jimgerdemannia flammicorona]|uniref:Kelch repeat protein n=1 Tax=Jimgerdemannia flammicorona TaxID=994334 RepID=A0A433QQ76_9FUNG|nr:hypothetical protein BC938DRAFT_476717 [Jimgerdemannia flammicorona]
MACILVMYARTAYSSDLTAEHVFDDMITFDTKNLVWNVLNIFEKPTPRDAYTVTMLRNGQMVFIGGYILKQISITSVSKDYAPLNDIHIFDKQSQASKFTYCFNYLLNPAFGSTNSAIWKGINATGVIPAGRVLHTAVLGIDDISVIICCGRNETSSFNDVAVLDTQNWYWTKPDVVGNAPSPRWGLSSVIVNGQMILFFGIEDLNKTENDVGILDTKTIPFRWITGFSPSPPSPSSSDIPDGPAFSGGLITIIAVICGVLVVVTAALIFVIIRKPWQKNAKTESPRGPDDVSQQIQPADPHILLPVKP